ncbi:hypothetical protein Trydic_g3479 [Trypoxylus dichotomus]
MGGTSSRPTLRKQTSKNENAKEDPAPNFRRLAKHRLSKSERANAISTNLQNIKSQIEQFDGFRGDSRYQNIQTELTKYSQEIQDVKSKSKPATKDVCSNIQADIVDLLRKLEEIVERNEGELDLAAVESHSFIDQTPKTNKKKMEPVIIEEPPQKNVNVDRDRTMMNLSGLEESTATLMKEINRAIDLENTSEFVVFEKKIGILYADLTAMDIEKEDPLYERKESISRKLIRYNNKLKTYKNRNSVTVDKEQQKSQRAEEELKVINQIEESLVDIEIKVTVFEDVKGDPKYRELDQILKGYWAKLQGLDDSSENNRRKKLRTINLIKTNLQALSNRAEENSTKIKAALEKINNLQEDVLAMKVVVDGFQGFKNDLDYTNVDQTIRSLWAKLNDVHSTNSKVEQKKNETIKTIQSMLTTLARNAEKYEAKVAIGREKLNQTASHAGSINNKKDNKQDKLVGELSEFENQWKRLSFDIERYLTIENRNNVEIVLKTLQNDIDICIKRLSNKNIETKQTVTHSSSTLSNASQNQNRANRPSILVAKNKNDKPKNKTTTFQPEQLLIDELSLSMENKENPQRAATVEHIIDEIEMLQRRLKVITEEIRNSSYSECNELKRKLEDVENDLGNIETNLNPVVTESKTEVLKTIVSLYKMIEEKSKKDTREEATKLKVIVENLQRIKKKVDCFSGTHGNIQFMQIQRELNECLSSLNDIDCKDNEKLRNNKKQISQKIDHYLNILDERSLKVDSQENLIAEVEKESFMENTNKLVDKLTEIRSKLEQFEENKSNNFDKDFRDAKIILNHINPKTAEDTKNVNYYKQYLDQLLTYYHSKLVEVPPSTNLEEVVSNLKREATELNNVTMENQNMNKRISLTLSQIRNLPVEGESETLKSKLMTDIKTIAVLLQTKDSILKDLDIVEEDIEDFSGPNRQKKYDAIDEKLSEIFLKIEEIPVNSDEQYVLLRSNLIKRVQNHKKMLNAKMMKAKEIDPELDGTEV